MEYSSEHQRARALLIQCVCVCVCVFRVPIFTCVFTSVCLRPHQSNPTSTTHTPSREVCHPIVGRAFPLCGSKVDIVAGISALDAALRWRNRFFNWYLKSCAAQQLPWFNSSSTAAPSLVVHFCERTTVESWFRDS